jgi:hypothetical protein
MEEMESGKVIPVSLSQPLKATPPILATGSPSIVAGIMSKPEASRSQSVMVTLPLSTSHVRSDRSAPLDGKRLRESQNVRKDSNSGLMVAE